MFVTRDPFGNPVDRRHPWNQHTIPRPAKRDFDSKYSWVMSPRWFDGKDHLACDTGGGPIAGLWATALGRLVDFGYVKSTGFDPCLPCGVHMYLGNGKLLNKVHSPMSVILST